MKVRKFCLGILKCKLYLRTTHGPFFVLTGLPVQVRDVGLKITDDMPRSDVNKEYYTQNMEREVK